RDPAPVRPRHRARSPFRAARAALGLDRGGAMVRLDHRCGGSPAPCAPRPASVRPTRGGQLTRRRVLAAERAGPPHLKQPADRRSQGAKHMKLDFIPLDKLTVAKTNMRSMRRAQDVSDILPTIRARGILVP